MKTNITKKLFKTVNTLFTSVVCVLLLNTPGYAIETITYYHHDGLGSTVAASDVDGNLLWREDYQPYGSRVRNPASADNTLWFTGKPEEPSLGLQYFGARWYDPVAGRFTGIDPVGVQVGNIHSFNRYAYANNNPFRFIDPDGNAGVDLQAMALEGIQANKQQRARNANAAAQTAETVSAVGNELDSPLTVIPGAGLAGGIVKGYKAGRAANNITKRINDVISSASRPARVGSQESRALQALKKKIDRGDNAFSGLPKTQDAANNLIRQTLGAKNLKIRTKTRNGQTVRDVFDQSTGRGVRTVDGQFDTFVNLNK